nr:insulinase family protein [Campylobacter sp.]
MKIVKIKQKGVLVPIIYDYDDSLPIVSLKLVFKNSGVVSEKQQGVAKLFAKILNEGTKKLGNTKFNRKLEIKDIHFSFSTGFEAFYMEISSLKENFNFALKAFCELLNDVNFDEKVLEKLKIKTLGSIASKKTDYDYQASLELHKLLYKGSRLQYPLIGDEKSISNIKLIDLKNFMNNLNLSNLFLTLCGDIKFDEINYDKLLDKFDKGKVKKLDFIATSTAKQTKMLKKDTKQAYIYFGSAFDIDKSQYYLANVALFVLGSSGFGSRLMEEIRVKRGLAYSVYARNEFSLSHKSVFGYLQTKNESKDEAIKLVKSEFDKFVKFGITQDELNQAKNFLLGSQPLAKETLFKRMDIAMREFYDGFELGEFDRNLAKIKALKLEDLNKFIKSHTEIAKLSFAVIYK